MKTIIFYTDTKKYMGWKKLVSYSKDWLEVKSWILSGNFCVIADQFIYDLTSARKALMNK